MQAFWVDIENEFADLRGEVAHLAARLARLGTARPADDSQEAWEAAHVCASAAEKIYTGFERVMARLVAELDQAPVGHAEGWHKSLLLRIANPFPGRPAVIGDHCYRQLDRLRAFRHRVRNTYGSSLDLDIVVERAREAVEAFDLFHRDVTSYASRS